MKVVKEFEQLRAARLSSAEPFGLVPTMGYLHDGHLSLVRRAKAECASVGVSIFVNPTQFGPQEDLSSYPRDLERDFSLLEAEAVEVVWTPDPEQVYGPQYQTWVEVEQLTQVLEGKLRPGHFRGVATVVAKLFNAFTPQRAYFGQKDAQQVVVIQRMVQDLNFPLELVVCPTVREPDGLAMSSRNAYLDPEQRQAATVLFRALQAAEAAFEGGERRAEHLRGLMMDTLAAEPLADAQYVSVADPRTLQELDGPVGSALLSMAVSVGATRLIDNLLIGPI
jgi:pantoate--beta-alanine ligase